MHDFFFSPKTQNFSKYVKKILLSTVYMFILENNIGVSNPKCAFDF